MVIATWLLVSVIVLAILIITQTLRAPKAPGRIAFALACVSALWWAACVLVRHSLHDYPSKLFFAEIAWFGIMAAPLYWSLSLVTYANGRNLEKRWHLWLIAAVVGVFGLLALTNRWHHGLYIEVLDAENMTFRHGWVYYSGLTIAYSMMVIVCVLGILRSIHAKGIHRLQIWILLASAALPWLGNVANVLFGFTLFGDDPTPFIFAATGCFTLVTQLVYELFILPPIGRDAIFAVLPDPVIVLDQQGRILEINPAAALLPGIPKQPIGKTLKSPIELSQLLSNTWPSDEDRVEIHLSGNGKTYELSCQSLAPWGRVGARMMTLRDITARKADELRLAALSKSLHDRLQENVILQTRLKDEASRDHLTGLHNRRHAHETLHDVLGTNGTETALFLIDIDHFKMFNDRYGHQTGDDVLIMFARMLQTDLKTGEHAFRWGGEEFLVVLPSTGAAAGLKRCEHWHSLFAQQTPPGNIDMQPTFSAGLFICGPGPTDLRTAVQAADIALYQAKLSGRNQTVVAGDFEQQSSSLSD